MADSKTPKNDQLRAMREENAKRSVIRQKQASWPPAAISLAPVEARVAKAKAAAITNKITNKRAAAAKWREANPELHRERARNAMRKRREKTPS